MFFADLDRTLIYSCDALGVKDMEAEALRLLCVETYKGRPASFVTEGAAVGIRSLLHAGLLVPVTTRSVEQYRRVRLPGPAPRFALAANGGRLLRDGVVDEDYSREIAAALDGCGCHDGTLDYLRRQAAYPFVVAVRAVEDLFCYAVVSVEQTPSAWIADLGEYASSVGWSLSNQGRKVYLLPARLSKGNGARRLVEQLDLRGFLAAGDTSTDESLLIAAQEAAIPAHSELAGIAALLGAAVTRATGVVAGEEIVRWACLSLGLD